MVAEEMIRMACLEASRLTRAHLQPDEETVKWAERLTSWVLSQELPDVAFKALTHALARRTAGFTQEGLQAEAELFYNFGTANRRAASREASSDGSEKPGPVDDRAAPSSRATRRSGARSK